jgi:hypothetical protein
VQQLLQHQDRNPRKEQTMTTTAKSSKDTRKAAFEFADAFLPLYEKGMEQLAELQKKSLEVVAQQNTEWSGALKKAFHFVPDSPGAFWIDAAGRTFEKYLDLQKEFLEHVVEHSHAVAKFNREYGEAETKQV